MRLSYWKCFYLQFVMDRWIFIYTAIFDVEVFHFGLAKHWNEGRGAMDLFVARRMQTRHGGWWTFTYRLTTTATGDGDLWLILASQFPSNAIRKRFRFVWRVVVPRNQMTQLIDILSKRCSNHSMIHFIVHDNFVLLFKNLVFYFQILSKYWVIKNVIKY